MGFNSGFKGLKNRNLPPMSGMVCELMMTLGNYQTYCSGFMVLAS
jgi:hypothetical protein